MTLLILKLGFVQLIYKNLLILKVIARKIVKAIKL